MKESCYNVKLSKIVSLPFPATSSLTLFLDKFQGFRHKRSSPERTNQSMQNAAVLHK